MALMQLLSVAVTMKRDEFVTTEVVRDGPDAVTPAEVEMLKAIWGAENVLEIRHVGMIERDQIFERERLRRRYGRKPETRPLADQLFPGSRATLPLKSDETFCPPMSEHEQDEARPDRWVYVGVRDGARPEIDAPRLAPTDLDAMSDEELKDQFRQRGLKVPTGPVKRETLLTKLKAGADAD